MRGFVKAAAGFLSEVTGRSPFVPMGSSYYDTQLPTTTQETTPKPEEIEYMTISPEGTYVNPLKRIAQFKQFQPKTAAVREILMKRAQEELLPQMSASQAQNVLLPTDKLPESSLEDELRRRELVAQTGDVLDTTPEELQDAYNKQLKKKFITKTLSAAAQELEHIAPVKTELGAAISIGATKALQGLDEYEKSQGREQNTVFSEDIPERFRGNIMTQPAAEEPSSERRKGRKKVTERNDILVGGNVV